VSAPDPTAPARPEDIKAVPVRHPGRWLAAVIVVVLGVAVVKSMATNKRFQWGVVGHYLFDGRVTSGVLTTIELTVAAMALGVAVGILIAVMRLSANPLIAGGSWLYVWFFRGTPVIVQLTFWYVGIAALYPTINLGVPFGPQFIHINSVTAVTGFLAVVLALGLNEGAYMSEIVRAGIISVDEGQNEASLSLGMTRLQTLRRIVLPQAMRVILPPTGNETISMLKTTSLAAFVSYNELFNSGVNIYNTNYDVIALLIVVSIWYLALTSVLYVGQYYLERYYARGSSRELPPTPWQRIRRGIFTSGHDQVALMPIAFERHEGGGAR
jgi:polar amino acid transport system permease protein